MFAESRIAWSSSNPCWRAAKNAHLAVSLCNQTAQVQPKIPLGEWARSNWFAHRAGGDLAGTHFASKQREIRKTRQGMRPMREEIQILLDADAKGCLVVEKDSHVLWERPELLEAQLNGRYRQEGNLLAPDERGEVSGPFPGCVQYTGATGRDFTPVGQTQHFVIFYPSDGPVLWSGPTVSCADPHSGCANVT
jgi:hypothetical protein